MYVCVYVYKYLSKTFFYFAIVAYIMEKKYAIVDPSVPKPKKPFIMNWTFCVLCQEDTKAALECSAKSK